MLPWVGAQDLVGLRLFGGGLPQLCSPLCQCLLGLCNEVRPGLGRRKCRECHQRPWSCPRPGTVAIVVSVLVAAQVLQLWAPLRRLPLTAQLCRGSLVRPVELCPEASKLVMIGWVLWAERMEALGQLPEERRRAMVSGALDVHPGTPSAAASPAFLRRLALLASRPPTGHLRFGCAGARLQGVGFAGAAADCERAGGWASRAWLCACGGTPSWS